MVIFGWGGGKPNDLGPAVPLRCGNCGNDVFYRYVVARKWFRLYFVPLVPYETRHLLICPVCSRGVAVSRSQIGAVGNMVEATAAWRAGTLPESEYQGMVESFLRGEPSVGSPAPLPPPGAPIQPSPVPGAAAGGIAPAAQGSRAVPPPPTHALPPPIEIPGAVLSHAGSRYALGFTPDVFGIWERESGNEPLERFPKTQDGWVAAWRRFSELEPAAAEVPRPEV